MKISQPNSILLTHSKSIRQLILDTGLPLNRAPEALGMTSRQFMEWWSSKEKPAESKANISNLSQFLGISEDQIISRNYNQALVHARIFKDPLTLPEKYSVNQFSYVRTSAHIFKFLVLTRGQHFADKIAAELNVSPLLYQNLNNKISLNYFLDLLEILELNGFNKNDLDTLSGVLFLGLAESELYAEFKKSTNYFECYNTLASNLNLFDANFIYQSDLDRHQYRMKTLLPYSQHDHFKWTELQINRLNRYRQLLVGWFPYLCGLPPIMPTVTHKHTSEGIETTCLVTFPKSSANLLSLV